MKSNTIFISIASYRDKLCGDTIKSIYENAKLPNNIYVGICHQNKYSEENTEHCLKDFEKYKNNIRIINIHHTEAKGPTYARYLCSTLYKDEDYFLQIDSHSKFVKNWDIKCILAIKALKNNNISKKPILSHYPRNYEDSQDFENKYNINEVTYIPDVHNHKIDKYFLYSYSAPHYIDTKNTFIKTILVTGGMIFCEGKFLEEVPYDPSLDYLFVGEEILHSLRFYTHGYDIFVPNQNIVFHYYTRKDEPKVWDDNKNFSKLQLNSVEKVVKVFEQNNNSDCNKILGDYGLGNSKTITQFKNLIKNKYLKELKN